MQHVVHSLEWPFFAPYVKVINALKRERNAVILAHNYQTPEIYNCVADFVGDSLQLAREATNVDADIIVQCGVHFMAETSKILNPDKTVLIPDLKAGCSLAASITGEDVRLLRDRYPGVPIVAYVNTSADVKAEVDICCTSANAPANGCPTPHKRFCSASANANTSRPHPVEPVTGVRKKPSDARGPKLSSAIKQPHSTMIAGARQVNGLAAVMVVVMGISGAANIEACPPPPNQILCRAQPIGEHGSRVGRYFAAGTGTGPADMLYAICSK